MAVKKKTKPSVEGGAPKNKKVANDGKSADASTPCTPPYCELYCSGGVWRLTGWDHGPDSICPGESIIGHDRCTHGTYTCVTPSPRSFAPPRAIPVNTADYVLDAEGRLMLTRGSVDLEHFCPAELAVSAYASRGPEEQIMAEVIRMVQALPRFVSITVNINAVKR